MTAQERNVDFLLMGTLRGFFFNPYRPEGLQFTAGPPKPLNVSVVPAKPDTDGGGFDHGLKCRVLTSRSVASNLCSFVEQLINRKFDWSANSSVKLPFIERGEVKIDEAGRIMEGFSVPFELYPPPLQTVCDEVFRELHDGLERFLKLLRWQQEIDAPHSVFDFEPALYWRIAEGSYSIVGQKRQGGFATRSPAGIRHGVLQCAEAGRFATPTAPRPASARDSPWGPGHLCQVKF